MQFLAVLKILLWKQSLILLLQMIKKENKNFRKMFIVTEYPALRKQCFHIKMRFIPSM